TFFLFLVQVITGVILTIYYVPSVEKAYASVYYISNFVNYGWLVRSIHFWSANLMVIFIFMHLLRVFITGSYKPPRELNWVAGMVLLGVTLGFSLTGYLLPWDQKAFWASTVTVSLVSKVPFAGETLHSILVGGEAIGQPTLTRFFSFHVMIFPFLLILLLVSHFWMIRRQGISKPL
ncbi:MAG: cytochrome b N-terminal domain-containing protein, partial [Actinomycetota bacterium]